VRIESNILGVIGQLERYQRAVPAAIQRALYPPNWIQEATAIARQTLEAIAQPGTRPLIKPFIETILALAIENGFSLSMRAPARMDRLAGLDLKGLRTTALEGFKVTGQDLELSDSVLGLFRTAFMANAQLARRVIQDWVEQEKDIDSRDDGRSPTEIADGIFNILFSDPDKAPKDPSTQGERTFAADFSHMDRATAAANLLKDEDDPGKHDKSRLVPFFARHAATGGMSDAELATLADEWLRAVLAAWRVMVRRELPRKIKAELDASNWKAEL